MSYPHALVLKDIKLTNVPWNRYGTEKAVGAAVKKSGVPRKELFITTKLWNNNHHPDDVEPALQQSLDELGLDYVDLYLIHWPVQWKRGNELFPMENGQPVLEKDIDLVDVCPLLPSGLIQIY